MSSERPEGSYIHGDKRTTIDGYFYKVDTVSIADTAHDFGVLNDHKHPLMIVLAVRSPRFFKGENFGLMSLVLSSEDTKKFVQQISELIKNGKLNEVLE